jgi:hypothetical protein
MSAHKMDLVALSLVLGEIFFGAYLFELANQYIPQFLTFQISSSILNPN